MTSTRAHRSIGEVLALLQEEFPDITISKIRFLESQGLLEPERTPSGYRKFFEPDVECLRWILLQQRDHFLPLRVIRERLESGEFESWRAAGADPSALAAVTSQPSLALDDLLSPATNGHHAPSLEDQPLPEPEAEPEPAVADETHRFDAILASARRAAQPADSVATEPPEPTSGPQPGAAETAPAPPSPPAPLDAGPLDPGPTTVSMTVDELARASGLEPRELGELERYGLLSSRSVGPAVYYDGEALIVAKLAAAFLRHGIEARHLRMYKTAAEREAGVFEQVIAPLVGKHDPAARREARERLVEMARLGEALHAALLRTALRGYEAG